MPNITNRDSLLSNLASALNTDTWRANRLIDIKVTLYAKNRVVAEFYDVSIRLQHLIEDIRSDYNYKWSEADRLKLEIY